MAVTAQTILTRVRTQLIDELTQQRWTDPELLRWLSDGQRTLVAMDPAWGWWLFGITWALAVFGVIAKFTIGFRFPRLSLALYLGMGWMSVVAIKPMLDSLTTAQLLWILAGGLFYTAGTPFYAWKSKKYTHAVWHLFVLAGVACHFVAVLSVVRAG